MPYILPTEFVRIVFRPLQSFSLKTIVAVLANFTISIIPNLQCDSKIIFKNFDIRTSGVLAKQNGLVTLKIVYKSTTDCIRPNFKISSEIYFKWHVLF